MGREVHLSPGKNVHQSVGQERTSECREGVPAVSFHRAMGVSMFSEGMEGSYEPGKSITGGELESFHCKL